MSTLILRFAGPLQSWGVTGRFSERDTRRAPSKSGVLGLIASAQGRRRIDPIEDLYGLTLGVRTDKPGRIMRDFHTAHDGKGKALPLSNRYYLSDAVFVIGISGPDPLLSAAFSALSRPKQPLFLGRRSCPPEFPLVLGLREENLREALINEPWQAPVKFQNMCRKRSGYRAHAVSDAGVCQPEEKLSEDMVADLPSSFDPRHRSYAWRRIENWEIPLAEGSQEQHDPMALLGGG